MSSSVEQRLYRWAMIVTILFSGASLTMTVANLGYGLLRPKDHGPAAAAPNYPERGYRISDDGRPKREFRVLGLDFLNRGFLSGRAATAMFVGTFFFPLIFLGYRADFHARERERTDVESEHKP